MNSTKLNRTILFVIGLMVLPVTLVAQVKELAHRLEPVFDETTIAYGHLDLTQIDIKKAQAKLKMVGSQLDSMQLPPDEVFDQIESYRKSLVQAGATRVFCTVSLYDLQSAPVFAVVVKKDGSLDDVAKMLGQFEPMGFAAKVLDKPRLVVVARTHVLERLSSQQLSARDDVAEVLKSTMKGICSLNLVPSKDHLRVVRELTPQLDEPFDFVTGKLLADGVRSASLTLHALEPIQLKARINSKDEKSAEAIQEVVKGLQQRIKPSDPERIVLKGVLSQISLNSDGNGLTLDIGQKEEQLWKALQPFFAAARTQSLKTKQVNDLKLILLAFHNFHDSFRYFPDLGRPKDKGKPGLSWRVHILPFLEQAELYEQFKLDEPWDSPHNIKLVEKIPEVYKPRDRTIALGKTLLMMPRGKGFFANPYVNENDQPSKRTYGRRMREFLDGTSNTIAVLPVAKKHAVIWTKPQDFTPNPKTIMSYLKEGEAKSLTFAATDGSVHKVSFESLDVKKIMAMLTIAGGEIVNWNE